MEENIKKEDIHTHIYVELNHFTPEMDKSIVSQLYFNKKFLNDMLLTEIIKSMFHNCIFFSSSFVHISVMSLKGGIMVKEL